MNRVQIAIQRLLGIPTADEVQKVIEFLFEKPTENLDSRIDELHATEARVANQLNVLRNMEQRIDARFKELAKAEEEMKRLAGDMTLAIYDAVEKIMAEIAEAKRLVAKQEKPNDE